ncbi:MAG: DinB family protein [Chloroflexi bacterium]|nr:DinB family protein [Chloroflexota bacterium]MBI3763411.1 DinB family protein [Chloroflexota bacterium]
MDTVTLIRDNAKHAHGYFDGAMADVTQEMADWIPPGVAHKIGAEYAHLAVAEDTLMNAVVRGGAPMFSSSWAGKTGISEPQMYNELEWSKRVKVEMAATRQYCAAVFAATEEYVGTLKDTDLARVIDISQLGMGQQNVAWILSNLTVGHVHDVTGEISCLKGLQGVRGYAE